MSDMHLFETDRVSRSRAFISPIVMVLCVLRFTVKFVCKAMDKTKFSFYFRCLPLYAKSRFDDVGSFPKFESRRPCIYRGSVIFTRLQVNWQRALPPRTGPLSFAIVLFDKGHHHYHHHYYRSHHHRCFRCTCFVRYI